VQWILGNFTNWKIYCSEPGIASTNNALESFNNIIKKAYTLNTRHSLSALVDIFMEHLLFDYSMDLKDLRKCFELRCLPAVSVKEASERIDGFNYLIREEDNLTVAYRKVGNNVLFAFSGVEAEVVKGADCWLAFCFEERSWVVGCWGFFLPFLFVKKIRKNLDTTTPPTQLLCSCVRCDQGCRASQLCRCGQSVGRWCSNKGK
jgi:hypothetical protein